MLVPSTLRHWYTAPANLLKVRGRLPRILGIEGARFIKAIETADQAVIDQAADLLTDAQPTDQAVEAAWRILTPTPTTKQNEHNRPSRLVADGNPSLA